jgi:hypothetical protein
VSEAAEDGSLAAGAEALAREIRRHASVLGRDADLPETAAAINAVRVAARRYVTAVMAHTGWGNVFADLEQGPASPAEGNPGPPGSGPPGSGLSGSGLSGPGTIRPAPEEAAPDAGGDPVIAYQSRYRLRIRDYDAALRLLAERAQAAGRTVGEELDDSHSGIIAALAELDGWDPYVYDQDVIEVLSAAWESAPE